MKDNVKLVDIERQGEALELSNAKASNKKMYIES